MFQTRTTQRSESVSVNKKMASTNSESFDKSVKVVQRSSNSVEQLTYDQSGSLTNSHQQRVKKNVQINLGQRESSMNRLQARQGNDMIIIEDSFRYGGFRSISSTKDNIEQQTIFKRSNKLNQVNRSTNNLIQQSSPTGSKNYLRMNRISSKYNNLTLSKNLAIDNFRSQQSQTSTKTSRLYDEVNFEGTNNNS